MKFLILLNIIFLFIYKTQCFLELYQEVCYGDLGCFDNRKPFSSTAQRPIGFTPESPEKIAPKFLLYTRENPTSPIQISHDVANNLFKPTSETKFFIHGFLDHSYNKHNIAVKDALLKKGDYNVIMVDWSRGNGFPYTQATANTRVVGAMIARLVNSLIQRYNIRAESFHIIGHSLGAHTAGYAGERVPNLGRITGLDPAGPGFEGTDTQVRLDESDAQYVEAIHTDGGTLLELGLGLMQKSGHVDFYVNGGKDQPNCPATSGKILSGIFNLVTVNVDGLLEDTVCSHMVAIHFFKDSIENEECKYTAFKCNSYNDFKNGKCVYCSGNGCNHMGFFASPRNDNGSLYLDTQNARSFPYCQTHFAVTLNSNSLSGQTQAKGTFKIALGGDNGLSSWLELDNSDATFKPGSSESRLVASKKYLGENINQIYVSYTRISNLFTLLFQDQWSFRNVQIKYGDNQKTFTFCPTQSYIKSGTQVLFNRC